MGGRAGRGRWRQVVLVVLALLVINVPFALHQWELHRVATSGLRVTATVVGATDAGAAVDLSVRLPAGVDPGQPVRTARVDRADGLRAARSKKIGARVLKGNPSAFHLDGQVEGSAALVAVLVADVAVLLVVVLSWRLGWRLRRPTLVGIAVEDVRGGEEGSLLDKQDDGTYLVNGTVARTGPSSLVLALRDRDVEIRLRDHDNPVPVGERAQVRAQLVG